MKINFSKLTAEKFAEYEEAAIDGRLIYDDYPAAEYKYFSQLSRLGYKNRHDGWSAELCKEFQREYRQAYTAERERQERFFKMACAVQENIRRSQMEVIALNKASTAEEKLRRALQALELILCEDGFAKRNLQKLGVTL